MEPSRACVLLHFLGLTFCVNLTRMARDLLEYGSLHRKESLAKMSSRWRDVRQMPHPRPNTRVDVISSDAASTTTPPPQESQIPLRFRPNSSRRITQRKPKHVRKNALVEAHDSHRRKYAASFLVIVLHDIVVIPCPPPSHHPYHLTTDLRLGCDVTNGMMRAPESYGTGVLVDAE